MIERKRFSGIMNLDDNDSDIIPNQHKDALNGVFAGGGNGLTFKNVPGNIIISNSALPPASNNECNGAFFDSVKGRIIWFNWNDTLTHGIYQYSFATGLVTKIFLNFTDTNSIDVLNFDPNFPIHSAAIVYRTESDGDLLYWTNGDGRPKYLNLGTVSSLAPFTDDMISAAKLQPRFTFTPQYQDNSLIKANYTNKKLFRFTYRWKYKNLEKSPGAPISISPLPNTPSVDDDPTKNCFIRVPFISGGDDYQKVELFGQVNIENSWSDFFLITTIDRDEDSLPPNTQSSFDFYNDGAYPTEASLYVDNNPANGLHYYDLVPNKAQALELLNGNVLIYGNITDGYNRIDKTTYDVSMSATSFYNTQGVGMGVASWDWGQQQQFALIYFDQYMKPVDIITEISFKVNTPDFSVQGTNPNKIIGRPRITASINHLPPDDAVSFAWLRASTTPKPLGWLTCDLNSDTNYYYLCIDNIKYTKEKNSGFLPSYEFKQGDRVKVMATYNGTFNDFTPFSVQSDYEILGVEERNMAAPNPIQKGTFIKIKKAATAPSPAYTQAMLIKIYSPIERVEDENQVFFEFGQFYSIGITQIGDPQRYHFGFLQNQTNSQPATFQFDEGDMYFRSTRAIYHYVNAAGTTFMPSMDANYSDYFNSAVNSNGRGWPIDVNAKEENNPVLVRWGGKYQSGTNINDLNRFYAITFDEVDRAKGAIQRLITIDRRLIVLQNRGCGQYGVYSRFIQNNQGQSELVTTNEIITTNNIQYFQGDYGLGSESCAVVKANNRIYFDDPIRGYQLRLSSDGITPISQLYKGQFYIRNLLTKYGEKTYYRSNGKKAKILKLYDYFNEEAVTMLQGGVSSASPLGIPYSQREAASRWGVGFDGDPLEGDVITADISVTPGSSNGSYSYEVQSGDDLSDMINGLVSAINLGGLFTAVTATNSGYQGLDITVGVGVITVNMTLVSALETIDSYTFSFSELRNGYSSFFSYFPEWGLSANDIIFTWNEGQLYIHNSDTYCNFYGVQYDCEIQLVFNGNLEEKKTWLAITEIANTIWGCPLIYTNVNSYGTQRQETSLVNQEFATLEGNFYAAIKRDANSRGGKINGGTMKGNYCVITLRKSDASDYCYITEVQVKTIDSPLNK